MIDWVSLIFEGKFSKRITGGVLVSYLSNGVLEWECEKRLQVKGSHSSEITVRTLDIGNDGNSSKLYISGNPAKFLQGHNLFGSDDLQGIAYSFVLNVLKTIQVDCDDNLRSLLADGVYDLKRVDCTASYALPSRSDVRSWLRAASQVATGRHQKKSAYSDQTLYFGQNSRRITLKAYCKGDELEVHPLPVSLYKEDSEKTEKLTKFADNLLRVEVTLRAMELKRRGLDVGSSWKYNKADNGTWLFNSSKEIIDERVKGLKLPDNFKLNSTELSGLSPRIQMAYKCWLQGDDVRAILPKMTFYRYRSELLKYGIDISCPNPIDKKPDNIVPLIRYLIAEPVGVPDWAIGSPFYHESVEYLKHKKISNLG